MKRAGIRSIAVAFPETVRGNSFWRERYPELIASLEERAAKQVWEPSTGDGAAWSESMAPYLSDVFRGSVERRVMVGEQRCLDLELLAARRALTAAKMSSSDIDLVLITTFFPDHVGIGNGVHFARAMEMSCPCWNIESACGSALADLLLAASMVESGRARNVMVVVSCGYARALDERNPMSWTSGDGASALIVSMERDGFGFLGSRAFATTDTIGAFRCEAVPYAPTGQTVQFGATPEAAAMLARSAAKNLPRCAEGALRASGKTLDELDFVVLPTPAAWFSEFGQRVLGIRPDQTIDTYARFSNTGPVLSPQNLYFAAREGRIRPGDHLLFMVMGSESSCGGLVMRWGDVAIAEEGAA